MVRVFWTAVLLPLTALAETLPRIHVEAGFWRSSVRGEIQSGLLPVDLQRDLALRNANLFFGTAMIRVAGRHRIVLQGSPIHFTGRNALERTITYNNRTYRVSDVVDSDAELTYFFAGHQWDFLARDQGNLGLRTGAAYLDASGQIAGAGVTAARSYRIGIPLVGAQGEAFVIPRILEVQGEFQGMYLGSYGRYIQGAGGVGVHIGPVGFRATYRVIDADIHERASEGANRAGVAPRVAGPVFSVVFAH